MNKIKVLHLIGGLNIGGAEKAALELAKYTNKEEFEILVVSIGNNKKMLPTFLENNIPVKIIETKKLPHWILRYFYILFTGLWKTSKIIKTFKPSILHMHMSHALVFGTILKMVFPKLKLIFNAQSFKLESFLGDIVAYLFKGLRSADIIFSKEMHQWIYRKDAVIIPNGIDVNLFKNKSKKHEKFTFLSAGRLVKQKNHLALLKPIKQMKEEGYDFQLFIAGEGELRENLEQGIQEMGLQDHVFLLGLVNNMPELYAKVHCLVMPSLWEGLPLSALEAGASELPVVITDVSSVKALISEENGYLVDEIDKELLTNMKEVIDNYDVALGKAAKLKKRVHDYFNVTLITRKHEELYKDLVNGVRLKLLNT